MRGRPRIDDLPALLQVADLLVRDPFLKPTTAIKRVAPRASEERGWGRLVGGEVDPRYELRRSSEQSLSVLRSLPLRRPHAFE